MSISPNETRPDAQAGVHGRPERVARLRGDGEPMPASAMPRLTMPPPGTAAGIETHELASRPSSAEPVRVVCIDYSPEQCEVGDVHDIPAFLAGHRPAWSRVRWINIDGLGNMDVVHALAVKYQLHPLAIEDVLHRVQSPKAEDYPGSPEQPGRLFIVARAIEERDGRLESDQVSMFLGRTTLLTFHQALTDGLDPIRQRIRTPGSRLRQNDVSFLVYVLLDGIADQFFPVLERFSERLQEIEEELLDRPNQATLMKINLVKRDLLTVRRAAWPLRELIAQLQRDRHETLSETAQTYLRDVYDHCVQTIDLVETYREISSGLADTYISIVSNRTNEIMKVLTVIGTIFIPLTFLAGVYGMNMPIPENASPLSYPVFWIACLLVAGGMLLWFRRRGWL